MDAATARFVVSSQTKRHAHLLAFIQHGVNSHATGMWRQAKDKVRWDWTRPPYWQHMARTMERGLFDAIFIADELAPYNNYEGSSDACVKYAVQCPTHEPSTIVPIIAAATSFPASASLVGAEQASLQAPLVG